MRARTARIHFHDADGSAALMSNSVVHGEVAGSAQDRRMTPRASNTFCMLWRPRVKPL